MNALLPCRIVSKKKLPQYDREEARDRVHLLTVRDGTCTERWGYWAYRDDFTNYKDRDPELPKA